MEENKEPNNDWKTVGGPGPEQPQKKKMGPVKAILLALLIVFLMCVIGLLIRMEVAGDGDYFAPIKKIFKISEEDDDKEVKEDKKVDKKGGETSERLALLSSDAKKKGVKHYSMKISLKDIVELSEELKDTDEFTDMFNMSKTSTLNTNAKVSKLAYGEEGDLYSDDLIQPRSNDFGSDEYNYDDNYLSDDWNYDDQIDPHDDDDLLYGSDDVDVDTYFNILDQYSEFIDGEFYIDLFAKNNEIVQLVIGMDYMPIAQKYYDYCIENDVKEVKTFDSAEDFAKYMATTLKMALTKETLIESLAEQFEEYGITEKDLEELIDINIDTGIFEFYLNGNDEINEMLADYIEQYEDEIKEQGIDVDNIFESAVPIFNENMKDEGYDIFKITVE